MDGDSSGLAAQTISGKCYAGYCSAFKVDTLDVRLLLSSDTFFNFKLYSFHFPGCLNRPDDDLGCEQTQQVSSRFPCIP